MKVTSPICGDELEGRDQIEGHDHEMPMPLEDAGAGFACPSCGRSFHSEEDLVAHQGAGHA